MSLKVEIFKPSPDGIGYNYSFFRTFRKESKAKRFAKKQQRKGNMDFCCFSRRNKNKKLYVGNIAHCTECGMCDCPAPDACNA